jgi:ABC-type glycerol-3-phosphate transport system permease component
MEKNRSGLFVYYRWLVLLLASGLCLLPLWATLIGGFKTPGDLRTNAFGLPRQWLFDNYVSIATSGRFWQLLGNSAFIALVTVVLTLLVSSMAAFVLAPRMFWQITMPLSRPILATVGVLSLVGSWNEYLLPLVMINNEALYPWPLGIMQYQGQYGTDWGKVLAFVWPGAGRCGICRYKAPPSEYRSDADHAARKERRQWRVRRLRRIADCLNGFALRVMFSCCNAYRPTIFCRCSG